MVEEISEIFCSKKIEIYSLKSNNDNLNNQVIYVDEHLPGKI